MLLPSVSLWQELFAPGLDSWLLTLSVGGYSPSWSLLCPPDSRAQLGRRQPERGKDRAVAANGGLGLAQETSPKASVRRDMSLWGTWRSRMGHEETKLKLLQKRVR